MSSSNLPAVVKAGTIAKARAIFGVGPDRPAELTTDGFGVRLPLSYIQRLGAKTTDSDTGRVIKANSRALVMSGPLNPLRYHFLISFNPVLLNYGLVSCPSFISFKDIEGGVVLQFAAISQIDLSILDWIFELRAID